MEKQSKLVKQTLKILSEAGVLEGALLIGSWCASFYRLYFSDTKYNPRIRTRDIDFLLPTRPRFKNKVDLEELMSPLGFEMEFYGKGYTKLESEELALEFIIPEVGPHKEKPHNVPELKFKAQPLRHMSMLWRNPIIVRMEGIDVMLPHPADFFVQKLVTARKRKGANRDKSDKDREAAYEVLEALLRNNDLEEVRKAAQKLTSAERKAVLAELANAGYEIEI